MAEVADSQVLVGIVTYILDELVYKSNWDLILNRMKINKFEIIKDLTKLTEDYENKNFKDIGIQIG